MDAKQAVIDIGSNTVRLVMFGGPTRAPVVLHNEKVTARLGKEVAETGLLSKPAMDMALAALERFSVLLSAQPDCRVSTVATAATRDAANGPEFLARVAQVGLNPRQLSGEEEAMTSAHGVIGAFPGAQGIVADLGGGSLELVRIKNGTCKRAATLPIGTLRLPSMMEGGRPKFAKRVSSIVAKSGWSAKAGEPLYLVGGTFRAIARYMMFHAASPLDDPHGYSARPEDILLASRRLARPASGLVVPGVSNSRLATLTNAAALLAAIVRLLKPSQVVFSAWGLREGLLVESFGPKVSQLDPLMEGTHAFAATHGAERASIERLLQWISPITALRAKPKSRTLMATVPLAIAARQVEPNLRAATLLDWALHKHWIGIDGAQRAMMAACLLASGNRVLPANVAALASPGRIDAATGWGLAIRLCIRLTGLSTPLIDGSELRIDDGRLVLRLNGATAPLATDPLRRDLKALADHLGLAAEVLPVEDGQRAE